METWKWGDLWVLITSAVGFLFVLVQLVVLHRRELDRRQQRAMFRADMYSPYKGDTAVAMSDNFAILILFPWCQLIGYLGIFFVYGSYLLELGLFADPFPVKFFLELMPMLLIRCSYASIVLFWRQLHMQRRHAVYGSYYRPRFTIMLFLECILLVVWLHVVMDLALFMIETGNHSTFLANFVIFYSFLALSLVVAVWRTRRSLLRDIESFVSRGRSSIGGPGKSFMKVRSISLVIGGALVFSLILAFIQEGLFYSNLSGDGERQVFYAISFFCCDFLPSLYTIPAMFSVEKEFLVMQYKGSDSLLSDSVLARMVSGKPLSSPSESLQVP